MMPKIYQINYELRHLRSFAVIAELLSFRKAAEELHIAQPALSRQVAQLEEGLNCRLFDRQKRQIILTPAGRALLDSLPALFEQLQETSDRVRRIAAGQAPQIRLGYSSAAMSNFLPAVIHEIQTHLPDCEFKFVEDTSDRLIESVMADRLDTAFTLFKPEIAGLVCLPIKPDEVGVVLQEGHALTQKKKVRMHDLKDEHLILFPRHTNPVMYDEILLHCNQAGFSPGSIIETAPRSTAIGLVAAGQGVATIASALKHTCIAGTRYSPLVQPGPMIRYCCIYRKETTGRWINLMTDYIHHHLGDS